MSVDETELKSPGGNLVPSAAADSSAAAPAGEESLLPAPEGASSSVPPAFSASLVEPETWGDRVGPKKLKHRHEVLAWLAACGASNNRIAEELEMSPSRISILLSSRKVQERIKQIREQYWKEKYDVRFGSLAPKALDFAEEIITGAAGAKTETRWEASKWLMEKVTGKPKQEVGIEAGGSIRQLLSVLDEMKAARSSPTEGGPIIDLQPHKPKQDSLSAWVDANVPALENEKEPVGE